MKTKTLVGFGGKQKGMSLLVILGLLAALALLAGIAAAMAKPGQGGDISPARARADAAQLVDAVGSARLASGALAGATSSTWGVFGLATVNNASVYMLGATNSGASAIADANLSTNAVAASLPKGSTAPLTMSFSVPLANGAVFAHTPVDIPAATCAQINLSMRSSTAELVDATLGAAVTPTASTTTVVAEALPAAFTTAAGAADGCFVASAGAAVGALVVKIM